MGWFTVSFLPGMPIGACAAKKAESGRRSECLEFECSRITALNEDRMPHHAEVVDNLRYIRRVWINNWAKYEKEGWHCYQERDQKAQLLQLFKLERR